MSRGREWGDGFDFAPYEEDGNDPGRYGEWTGPVGDEYSATMPKRVVHEDLGAIDGSAYPSLHLCACQEYVPEALIEKHVVDNA